ncbi:MAG: signal peptidase I [Litoreibacter sp.]
MRRALLWGVLPFVCAFLLFCLVFRTFWIPSGSMRPGLEIGDYVVTNRAAYGFPALFCGLGVCDVDGGLGVERGDVAVFLHPSQDFHYVKRIMGLPGDRVQMLDGIFHLNGTPLGDGRAEKLTNGTSFGILNVADGLRGDTMPTTVVPPGHVFALGDNRDNSNDSRFSTENGGIGMVPLERMVARVELIVMSLDGVEGRFMRWVQ